MFNDVNDANDQLFKASFRNLVLSLSMSHDMNQDLS